MRTVMVATPAHDGRVDALYLVAMANSIKLFAANGIDLCPVIFPYEAMLPRARNELLALAVGAPNVTDVIWIDSDQGWEPKDLWRLLTFPVDVVGGAVPKKTDGPPQWNVKALDEGVMVLQTGLAEVGGLGTGFLRMSREAFAALWENGAPYRDAGNDRRMAFEYSIATGELVSEDNVACQKLRSLGFPIFLDIMTTCDHVGSKTWRGSFVDWLKQQKNVGHQPHLKVV